MKTPQIAAKGGMTPLGIKPEGKKTETPTPHTPGPWVYDQSEKPLHKQIVIGPQYRDSEGNSDIAEVAVIRGFEVWASGEQRANARLLAAAPELLEVAKSALFALREFEIMPRLQEELGSTIAKAEGV